MNKSFLFTTPNIKFKDTYLDGIKEFQQEGRTEQMQILD